MKQFLTIAVLAFSIIACAQRDTGEGGAGADPAASITGPSIRAHMEVLAADDMEGREAGSPGFDKAAAYVAGRFEEAGLEPLGDEGAWYQSIDFFQTRLLPETAGLSLKRDGDVEELSLRDDFVCGASFGEEKVEISAPLVFVGHGIVAPEYGHDDYAGVDVEGKILVVLSGAPPRFDTDQRAYYSSRLTKRLEASKRGASGMIGIRTPVDIKRTAWERFLPGIGTPEMRWIDASGRPFEAFPDLKVRAVLSEAGAAKLFGLAGRDLEAIFGKHAAGETGSFDLPVEASFSAASSQERVASANVLGLLRGSDPVLRDEHVIYTAHLDHIGIRPGEEGDDIHNGAYDNSAGIASILEIARAMSTMAKPPRRSVIFAAVTAEEKGLQGSSYLAKNPPVPASRLVANINIDMPYLAFPVADIEAFGAEHSTLQGAVQQATADAGMALTPDPMPEQVRFVRSDQFSFVKEGIPALAFKAGSRSSDEAVDGSALLQDFLKNHYHRPSDDLSLPYSDEGARRFVRTAFRLGLIVAEADQAPRWKDGDFFGGRFGR